MPLLVETKLKETKDKGIGLFADEIIKKGQRIYCDDPNFDRIVSEFCYANMSELQREFIKEFAAYSKTKKQFYLCVDNARFWNHSENPNTQYLDLSCEVIALKDIPKGEELTSNYREFCDSCKDGDFGFVIIK